MGAMESLFGSDLAAMVYLAQGPNGQNQQNNQAPESDDFQGAVKSVPGIFPALSPYMDNVVVQRGEGPGHLEFYPPWESENPNPGKITLQIRDKELSGDDLNQAIAGDMLHYIGAIDPTTGQPINKDYYALKQNVINSRSPEDIAMDNRAYQEDLQSGEKRSINDWMSDSRADAYIRGYLTPDKNDEWRRAGIYKGKMLDSIQAIENHLKQKRD